MNFVFLHINVNHKIVSIRQNLEKNKNRTVVRFFLRFLPFARGKYLCTSSLAKCKILLDFSQPNQRVGLLIFLYLHLFLHAEARFTVPVFYIRIKKKNRKAAAEKNPAAAYCFTVYKTPYTFL